YRATDNLTITPLINYQSQLYNDLDVFYPSFSNAQQATFKNGKLIKQPGRDSLYQPILKIEADLGFAELTSVSSYLHRHATAISDSNGAVGRYAPYGDPRGVDIPTSYSQAAPTYKYLLQKEFSQEVRLASADGQARLSWVVGGFYSWAHQEDLLFITSP